MGIERTSESFIASQKNEGGKYFTTNCQLYTWDESYKNWIASS